MPDMTYQAADRLERERLLNSLKLREKAHERISFLDIRILDDLQADLRPRDSRRIGNMMRHVGRTNQPLGLRDKKDRLVAVAISPEQ